MPQPISKMQLPEFLCQKYGRKVPLKPNEKVSIAVDDRDKDDVYQGFCSICIDAESPVTDMLQLQLDYPPVDEDVQVTVNEAEGTWKMDGVHLTLPITYKSAPMLRKLAKTIRRVVGRGKKYSERNWKWIAPRTANSLERLAGYLAEYRRAMRTDLVPA